MRSRIAPALEKYSYSARRAWNLPATCIFEQFVKTESLVNRLQSILTKGDPPRVNPQFSSLADPVSTKLLCVSQGHSSFRDSRAGHSGSARWRPGGTSLPGPAQLARVAPFEVARLGSLQMSRKEIKSLNQRPGESPRASIVQDSAQSKRDIPQEAGLSSPTP